MLTAKSLISPSSLLQFTVALPLRVATMHSKYVTLPFATNTCDDVIDTRSIAIIEIEQSECNIEACTLYTLTNIVGFCDVNYLCECFFSGESGCHIVYSKSSAIH